MVIRQRSMAENDFDDCDDDYRQRSMSDNDYGSEEDEYRDISD